MKMNQPNRTRKFGCIRSSIQHEQRNKNMISTSLYIHKLVRQDMSMNSSQFIPMRFQKLFFKYINVVSNYVDNWKDYKNHSTLTSIIDTHLDNGVILGFPGCFVNCVFLNFFERNQFWKETVCAHARNLNFWTSIHQLARFRIKRITEFKFANYANRTASKSMSESNCRTELKNSARNNFFEFL